MQANDFPPTMLYDHHRVVQLQPRGSDLARHLRPEPQRVDWWRVALFLLSCVRNGLIAAGLAGVAVPAGRWVGWW